MPSLPVSFKEFVKDPVKAILYLAIIGIVSLFTFLYKSQESKVDLLKEEWAKCENGNYQRDIKIDYLLASKAKSDSLLNRITGKLEAMEELKRNSQ